jgi:hypothetical protein
LLLLVVHLGSSRAAGLAACSPARAQVDFRAIGAEQGSPAGSISPPAIISGPATNALHVYEVQEVEGSIQIRARSR